MNELKMKVHNYDANTHSLSISFASDETNSQNPDDYSPLNYQPNFMFPDVTDFEDMKKKLAIMGLSVVDDIIKYEKLTSDIDNKVNLESLVGQTILFNIDDLKNI